MKTFVIFFVFCGVLLGVSRASLASARQAQALLGPATWSRVVRIENEGSRSTYPATVFALIFEYNGLLWFYCDADGTQSLSLHLNRLAQEKRNLAPLLRAISPGFRRCTVMSTEVAAAAGAKEGARGADALPNGCFIASIVALRRAAREDPEYRAGALLSYYVDAGRGPRGHTVVVLEKRDGRTYVIDAQRSRAAVWVQPGLEAPAREVALAAVGAGRARVVGARWVPAGTEAALTRLDRQRVERELRAARSRAVARR